MRQTRWLVNFLAVAALSGCTGRGCSSRKDIPPEEQLHSYISRAVNITKPSERQALVDFTTGTLKSHLVNMSDEAFRQAYIDKKWEFRTFELVERRDLSERDMQLDFRIVYKSWRVGERPDRAPLVDTRNRAFMTYEYGRWALARVESLETNFAWEVGLPMDDVRAEEFKEGDPPKEIRSSREVGNEPEGSEVAP